MGANVLNGKLVPFCYLWATAESKGFSFPPLRVAANRWQQYEKKLTQLDNTDPFNSDKII